MSYILDALKKSESERQRQHAPGIADVPREGQRRGPAWWAWLLLALLAINAVVLVGLLARTPTVAEPVAVATSPAATQPPPVATPAPAVAQSANEPVQTTQPPAVTVNESLADIAVAPTSARPAATEATPVRRTAPAPAARPRVSELPTTYLELRAGGRLDLGDLHLDIHVYSDTPAERFVFINMNKYREQERLAEGPRVEEITPEGVLLAHNGQRFLLPRD